MNKNYTAAGIAWRIWILTAVFFAIGLYWFILQYEQEMLLAGAFVLFARLLAAHRHSWHLCIFLPHQNLRRRWQSKFLRLLLLQFFITICYGCLQP
jgi:hypothetical protein